MKFQWWMQFFAPDKGGSAGEGGKPTGEDVDPEGDEEDPDDGGKPGSDDAVAGLKSALQKERDANKDLRKQLKDLTDQVNQGGDATKELETLKAKLADYDFRDQRDTSLEQAIKAVTSDGKFVVDREKVAKLAAKLRDAETLEDDLAEIVETLKTEKSAAGNNGGGGQDKPPITGQPTNDDDTTDDLDPKHWAELKRKDPEAYRQMIKNRRQKRKFSILG